MTRAGGLRGFSAVVPAGNIGRVVDALCTVLPTVAGHHEVIVVELAALGRRIRVPGERPALRPAFRRGLAPLFLVPALVPPGGDGDRVRRPDRGGGLGGGADEKPRINAPALAAPGGTR